MAQPGGLTVGFDLHLVVFYRREVMPQRGIIYRPLSVCLSVCPPVRHKFVLSVVLEWLGGSGWFSAWRLSSTHPTSCCKEIRNFQKCGHFRLILNFVAEHWT